ncbi:MAG: SurA N-terminal domain-containing protein [Pseudorhodobacter sp.]|nr:SurA N-terminal domain-containing protein [Pseudorhodobacter sp.]
MAKHSEDSGRKKGKGTSVVVWILMGMLVLGLGGFGVTNFGGGVTAIGEVGKRKIDVNDYARALQQEINALSAQFGTTISLQQAQAFGLDRQVRQQLVNATALANETDRIGLSAGDARVAQEILAMSSFRGPSGQFDRETYRFTLQRNNMTEAAYESRLRDDLARALLQGAVTGGFTTPDSLRDTLYSFISERRAISLLRLTALDLEAQPAAPTEADLQAHYDANIAEFTRPEARRITYASLLPQDVLGQVSLSEEDLRALYQDRIAEFVQPERRLVERLVFADEAAANEAKARLEAGTSFETLVADRGLSLSDVDLGDQSQEDLGAAGAAIFALTEPGVVGPFTSDLGPALFRMNGILAAQNTPFEEARADLAPELEMDAARRLIADRIEELDDRLAAGATLEDLAKETGMTLAQIDYSAQTDDGIAGYPDFRAAAEAVAEGDFPEILQLDEGGVFALRLDEIVPATPIPFAEATDLVTESWQAAAVAKALSERAIAIKAEIEAGASLGAFGITEVIGALTRSSTVTDAPATLIEEVFAMEEGQARVITAGDFTAVAVLDRVTPGATDGPDVEALKGAISAQTEQAFAQDAFVLFNNALTRDAGITLNDAAIAAVHAQFQ